MVKVSMAPEHGNSSALLRDVSKAFESWEAQLAPSGPASTRAPGSAGGAQGD